MDARLVLVKRLNICTYMYIFFYYIYVGFSIILYEVDNSLYTGILYYYFYYTLSIYFVLYIAVIIIIITIINHYLMKPVTVFRWN